MNSNFFNYELPKDRIAQRSAAAASGGRDGSRLLSAKLRPEGVELKDFFFFDLPDLLQPGDLLVLNDSKVVPWRFFLQLEGSEVELLLVRLISETRSELQFEALARPMRKLEAAGEHVLPNGIKFVVRGRTADGERLLVSALSEKVSEQPLIELLADAGSAPIPPYIRKGRADESDRTLYQTVFAKEAGSVAAPTAGLHFTAELLQKLESRGIEHTFVTLHVGPASFLPVRDGEIDKHIMQTEEYKFSEKTLQKLRVAKEFGKRIVAVGTTTVRSLESLPAEINNVAAHSSQSQLFIQPGYQFKWVDALITNFHQPLTTHLLLVAAFVGEKTTEEIYSHALRGEYRFLSYGDAMLLEREKLVAI